MRGEIWSVAAPGDYAGKPRPAVIVSADFPGGIAFESVTICGLTTIDAKAPLFRIPVDPAASNGLRKRSFVMADKILTVPRARLGGRIGALSREDMRAVNRALILTLGLSS